MAANALKCPIRYDTSEDTILLNMVGGNNLNTQKYTIPGLSSKLTPFDFEQDSRVAKCSVMCAPDHRPYSRQVTEQLSLSGSLHSPPTSIR